MLALIVGETRWYLTQTITDHIVVDTTLDQKLPIGKAVFSKTFSNFRGDEVSQVVFDPPPGLNITFPNLRCDEVSVDTVDSSGENQINIHAGYLHKRSVDKFGNPARDREPYADECLSCHGAQEHMGDKVASIGKNGGKMSKKEWWKK